MKKFILHITILLAGTLAIMAALDFAYTSIYEKSNRGTKFQALRSNKGKKIDYLFLGSSRVENGIIPEIVEQKTGKTALNAGFTASKLNDIYTMLKLVKEYDIKTEAILIQIDYIFDIEGHSNTLPYQMAPYIHDNEATEEYFDQLIQEPLFGVPFYRYCAYEQKIGLREIVMNVIGKKTKGYQTKGYSPIYGSAVNTTHKLPSRIRLRNPVYENIVAHCRENNINVIFYCAPFWIETKNMGYIDKLKERVVGLKDYSRLIDDPTMFKNNPHLNDKGARFFTAKLVDDLLLKPKQEN